MAALLLVALVAAAQARENAADTQTRRALETRVTVRLRDAPMRAALSRLAEAAGLVLWLDRRVDPDQPVVLEAQDEPIGDVFNLAAENAGCAVVCVGGLVYVGPREAVAELPAALDRRRVQVEATPRKTRRAFLHTQAMSWPELAQPRDLIERMLGEQRLRLDNPEAIPHDLWRAGALPEAPLADRLTILLYGFGLDWTPAEGTPRLVRITPRNVIESP